MQPYHHILSVSLFKGTIIAITDDGDCWQWIKIHGDWRWQRCVLPLSEGY